MRGPRIPPHSAFGLLRHSHPPCDAAITRQLRTLIHRIDPQSRAFSSSSATLSPIYYKSSSSLPLAPTIRHLLSVDPHTLGPDTSPRTIHGWVRSLRAQKNLIFLQLTDGSTPTSLQCVAPANTKGLHGVSPGASVRVRGELVKSPAKGQAVEMKVVECEVVGPADPETYPLPKTKLTLEYLREPHVSHLRSRTQTFSAVWRIRDAAEEAVNEFFKAHSFLRVHTPIITSNDCEGGGEVFRVEAEDRLKEYIAWMEVAATGNENTAPRVEGRSEAGGPQTPPEDGAASHQSSITSTDPTSPIPTTPPVALRPFFTHPVYLTVSSQLHLESLLTHFPRVYTLSPCFRAEPSNTPRHLAEFWMLEAEWAWCDDIAAVCDVIEAQVKSAVTWILEGGRAGTKRVQRGATGLFGGPQGEDRAMPYDPREDLAVLAKNVPGADGLVEALGRLADGTKPFLRVTYTDAVEILRAVGGGVGAGVGGESGGEGVEEQDVKAKGKKKAKREEMIVVEVEVDANGWVKFLGSKMGSTGSSSSPAAEPEDQGTSAPRHLTFKLPRRQFSYPVEWGLPLQTEHERFLAEMVFKYPVFVTDYPAAMKPFYMKVNRATSSPSLDADEGHRDPSRLTVACTDLLVPGVGELCGGSVRETDLTVLSARMEEAGLDASPGGRYGWYLDLRRWGGVPHAGYGMGFERFLMLLTGMGSLKDLVVWGRWAGSCKG
ncbi:asparaginyl-tRNA synthetase [Gonapodya prolifera JEL478]|uniref:Asparaginyl-tRNA synthetase n=1 Tax=Gonapodya prolifera (strain JEL478) TaxID=1344416 RepID=A0A139AF92_GONPJ|nr:asparaginyl-tRNA synthetase [Gonapodya prolifera JEL478]|eukprot:KXS15481.1 asparaginyl-tRNA synthetase [Gonapodya prolifera JEL478]